MPRIKTAIAATVGNAIEYYDVTLYGCFTAFLSPLFFPSENLLTSQLASLGVFAVGFLARPVGGIIFGYIGDRFGRKRALVLAVQLVTVPTTIIGFLPTYAHIGIFAPLILVLCRILQGISTGGEYSGAAIFLSEHHRGQNEGLICSILPSSSLIGAILGTGLGGLSTLPSMPSWAWRIPFLIGGIFGIIGYFLRNSLIESPEFLTAQKGNYLTKLPILEAIKQDKSAFFCTLGLSAYHLVLFYIPVVYIVQFMLPKNVLTSSGMFLNTAIMGMLIIFFPLMGFAADKFGKTQVMLTSAFMSLILALPIFLFLNTNNSLKNSFIILVIFSLLCSSAVAPSVSFLPLLFPIQERYSAMALSVGLGEALGGTTPLICHALVSSLNSRLAPAFYLMLWCCVSGVTIIFAKTRLQQFKAKKI